MNFCARRKEIWSSLFPGCVYRFESTASVNRIAFGSRLDSAKTEQKRAGQTSKASMGLALSGTVIWCSLPRGPIEALLCLPSAGPCRANPLSQSPRTFVPPTRVCPARFCATPRTGRRLRSPAAHLVAAKGRAKVTGLSHRLVTHGRAARNRLPDRQAQKCR
jgi:hypothetical protein